MITYWVNWKLIASNVCADDTEQFNRWCFFLSLFFLLSFLWVSYNKTIFIIDVIHFDEWHFEWYTLLRPTHQPQENNLPAVKRKQEATIATPGLRRLIHMLELVIKRSMKGKEEIKQERDRQLWQVKVKESKISWRDEDVFWMKRLSSVTDEQARVNVCFTNILIYFYTLTMSVCIFTFSYSHCSWCTDYRCHWLIFVSVCSESELRRERKRVKGQTVEWSGAFKHRILSWVIKEGKM